MRHEVIETLQWGKPVLIWPLVCLLSRNIWLMWELNKSPNAQWILTVCHELYEVAFFSYNHILANNMRHSWQWKYKKKKKCIPYKFQNVFWGFIQHCTVITKFLLRFNLQGNKNARRCVAFQANKIDIINISFY